MTHDQRVAWWGLGGLAALTALGFAVAPGREIRRNPGGVALVKRTRQRGEPGEGTHTVLTFSDGTERRIQRMRAAEAHGVGGWHYIDGPAGELYTYLGDSEADAVAALLRQKNRG